MSDVRATGELLADALQRALQYLQTAPTRRVGPAPAWATTDEDVEKSLAAMLRIAARVVR